MLIGVCNRDRKIPRARPYYNLVKAVLAQAVRDGKPLKGDMATFMFECYWTFKEMTYMQEEDFNLSKRMNSDPKVATVYHDIK